MAKQLQQTDNKNDTVQNTAFPFRKAKLLHWRQKKQNSPKVQPKALHS